MAEKYVPEYKDANVMGKWSYFEEFYKNCKPKANDPDGIELENKFVDWVGTGKFSRGEEVRELPKILKNPEAREAFEAKGFPDAWEDVKTDSPELDSTLWRAVARAIKELHDAPKSEINDVRDGNDAKRRRLLELKAEIDEFLKHAK